MSQAFGALLTVLGVLLLFAVGFQFFLILPFFVFMFGIIAMIISDRKRSAPQVADGEKDQEVAERGQSA